MSSKIERLDKNSALILERLFLKVFGGQLDIAIREDRITSCSRREGLLDRDTIHAIQLAILRLCIAWSTV